MTLLLDPKYPGEKIILEMDFTPRLGTGITVEDGEVLIEVVAPGEDEDVDGMLLDAPEIASPFVRQFCADGIVGNLYRVTYRAIASDGEELEDVRFFEVSDSIKN